jgi:hypothetical protein
MGTTNPARPRYTIDLSAEAREHLNQLAKTHKLTQGEAIEVMLDIIGGLDNVDHIFAARRQHKLDARTRARELAAKLRTLPPEALAQVEALVTP